MSAALLLLIAYLFIAVTPAQAYLDPGTGSYVTQILIGSLVGVAYLVKTYWQQIKNRLDSLFHRKKDDEKNES